MGSVPPHYDREMMACVLCDNQLKQDMEIRIPTRNTVQPRRTNAGRGVSGRGGGRGLSYNNSHVNGRAGRNGGASQGIKCFKCGGPHYASACPNNQRR